MTWTKERQRWFKLVLMNTAAIVSWYSQRSKFSNDQLWLLTLPVILIFFNGIFFATIISRSAVTAGDVQTTAGSETFRFPWRTNAVIFIALGLFLTWACVWKYHTPELAILPVIVIARAFAGYRRKIVISENQVVYWPPIGSPQRIEWADVESVKLGQMGENFLVGPVGIWPAAKFQLRNGVTSSIPLGMPDHERVFHEIVRHWKNRGEILRQ